jgi:3-deoxy-7-phosphoheptulonate synthase
MVVVMRSSATRQDVDKVVDAVTTVGGEAFVSRGRHQTIVGLVGDLAQFAELPLHAFPGVEDVIRVSKPYKLVSTETHPRPSTVSVGDVPIGRDTFTLIAGPCAVESEEQAAGAARMARDAGATILRGGAYKPRTSPYAFQGLGQPGLDILAGVAADLGMPFVTEVVTPADVQTVAEHADMLQVGTRNTLDVSAVPVAQSLTHLPVIVDPSHSGGKRDLVLPLTRAAIAAGADGAIVDVHPKPATAQVDGAQALVHDDIAPLHDAVVAFAQAAGRRLATPQPQPERTDEPAAMPRAG